MSVDFNQSATPMPGAHQPKKGGGMKWILIGGIGCLGVVGICIAGIVGAGFWGLSMVKNNPEFLTSKATVQSSPRVEAVLGSPITVGDPGTPQPAPGETNTFILTAPVSGPDGDGTMTWKGMMSQDGQSWTTLELSVRAGGENIDLKADADSFLDLDIDLGE